MKDFTLGALYGSALTLFLGGVVTSIFSISPTITTTHPIEPTITIVTTNGISDTTYIYKENEK